ncbi:hypothetical protein DTO212C5_2167 [Paecilomyces variotii]|nr:hypothetical protein DTO212C5_2167 [Paecilomyces variotii]KAJ9403064.1 hypothetical protein DTO282F9_474 [Paecilomyces variotii]
MLNVRTSRLRGRKVPCTFAFFPSSPLYFYTNNRGRQYKGRVGQTVQNVLAIQAPGTRLLLHFSPRTETLKPA